MYWYKFLMISYKCSNYAHVFFIKQNDQLNKKIYVSMMIYHKYYVNMNFISSLKLSILKSPQ